ncbi:hypothetical protein EPIB1_2256 [Tritonibacter mobilis]|nr:hypothetical protein EPIB1_2256 [Tritonibacter mobilis]
MIGLFKEAIGLPDLMSPKGQKTVQYKALGVLGCTLSFGGVTPHEYVIIA